MAMLEVNNLSIQFGGLHAVDNFHMKIEKGELYGLIGPNGAGKTTVFNLLSWTDRTLQEKALSTSTRQVLPVPSRISVFSRI